jgi:hypothetical protein
MALGSTQPLVKMSTRNIPGDKGGRCVRQTTSPPSRAECQEIWEPKPSGTLGATPGLLRDSYGRCAYSWYQKGDSYHKECTELKKFKITEPIVEQRILLLMTVRCEIVMCKKFYVYYIHYNNLNLNLVKSRRFIPLRTTLYLTDLKTQSVPRSKHSLPRL